MGLLLDTHVLLWALTDDPRLSPRARAAISDGRTRLLVSAVSAWEMTIKSQLGKLRVPTDLPAQLVALHADPLDISITHCLAVAELPPYHSDPFDRLLVAQARTERLTLVTHDALVQRYDVPVLAV